MNAKRTITVLGAVAVMSLGLAACGGGEDDSSAEPANSADEAAVTIDTFMYEPDPIEVDAGTTVEFTNDDDILHTVTEGTRGDLVKGGFDEQLDGAGSTAEVTFDEPGKVAYICTIHDGMDGSVVVR